MKEILKTEGEWLHCTCGCKTKLFIAPIHPDETHCSVCFKEIIPGNEQRAYYKGRCVAIIHPNCEPFSVKELFPTPS